MCPVYTVWLPALRAWVQFELYFRVPTQTVTSWATISRPYGTQIWGGQLSRIPGRPYWKQRNLCNTIRPGEAMPFLRICLLLSFVFTAVPLSPARAAGQNRWQVASPNGQIVFVLSSGSSGSGAAPLRYS